MSSCEATFGFYTGSLALLADAAHNLTDVGGLVLAWGVRCPQPAPTERTQQLRFSAGLSILAAIANGVALLIAVGGLAWEAIGRIALASVDSRRYSALAALAGHRRQYSERDAVHARSRA